MYPKLVRDNIPQLIAKNNKRIPKFYHASDEEYWKKLKEKLVEEVDEFLKPDHSLEELADILEVIDAIIAFKKISYSELEALKNKKAQSHGTFSNKIILQAIQEP